ncbi:hypothetical protein DFP93_103320 [Aneurinibacillus soli]|uniref:Uncharacterized protein n=1 Tax=Aneurinibacillus soli TaxID=1500254 RepID=A0A0U5C8Y6_9BACL|nr:hypothetical protein DFP93_103320 [Aneurinibacillus soli]BAU28835.1 hypothetical protein CB4_03012 [Aneurinibacillus soli]
MLLIASIFALPREMLHTRERLQSGGYPKGQNMTSRTAVFCGIDNVWW